MYRTWKTYGQASAETIARRRRVVVVLNRPHFVLFLFSQVVLVQYLCNRSMIMSFHGDIVCQNERTHGPPPALMAFKFLGRVVLFAILVLVAFAQPSPPAEGIQIGTPEVGWDIRFPLTITQCEPVFIYYNNTWRTDVGIGFVTLDAHVTVDGQIIPVLLIIGPFPLGVGYFEWICNIPAGLAFYATAGMSYPIVVQSGPISSCLGVMTTTNSLVAYETTNFVTFTASRPITTPTTLFFDPSYLATYVRSLLLLLSPDTYPARSTVPFPTGAFPTLTVKYESVLRCREASNETFSFKVQSLSLQLQRPRRPRLLSRLLQQPPILPSR